MIEQCCDYLSVLCIWLYVLITPCTCFRVNPHSITTHWNTYHILKHVYNACITQITRLWNAYTHTMKRVCDMTRIYSQMYHTDKHSQHSSIIWPVWLNGWVFVYKLSGCRFESHCSHIFLLWWSLKLNCIANIALMMSPLIQ